MLQPKKFYTGVGLDPETVTYLAQLSRQTSRTRSWLINAIVREHARQTKVEEEAQAAAALRQEIPTIRI